MKTGQATSAPLSQALPENTRHVEQLCALFDLGGPISDPVAVSGGLHHRMWCLDTQSGRYAVKQVADDMDMRDAGTVRHLNATEAAAQAFAECGIPALASLSREGQHLQVLDGTGYLVFPWTAHRALDKNSIGEYHAATVAEILARMHLAGIDIAGLEEPVAWPLTPQHVREILQLARQRNAREAIYLIEREDDILRAVETHEAALADLSHTQVISHGDLDHKNVLWNDAGEPLLIDWESARPINPTYELLLEALDWSGITANFETGPFEHFLRAYVNAGGSIIADLVPRAFDAVLGTWVNWMLFNVDRAAEYADLRQRAIGTEQIDVAVGALLRLEKNIPRLREIAVRCASG